MPASVCLRLGCQSHGLGRTQVNSRSNSQCHRAIIRFSVQPKVLNKKVTMCSSLVDRAQHLLDPGSPDAMRLVWTLLVLYCTMAVPALAWAAFALRKLLKRSPSAKAVPAAGRSRDAQPDSKVQAEPLSAEQAMHLIKGRRSIYPKDFTGELVDRATLEQVLEAANWAPTHGKTEPWRFTVLSPEGLDQLIAVSLSVMERVLAPEIFAMKKRKLESKMKLFQKATFIALNVKRQAKPDKLMPEWEEIAATSCAVQNLQLAAQPFGVVGYWSSWQPFQVCNDPEFKQFLGINADDIQIGFFLAGRASPSTLAAYRAPRRGPIVDKIIWK